VSGAHEANAVKRLVGVIHLPPLPGSPRASLAIAEIARSAAHDARALADAGFDLAMIENFGDTPFFAGAVPRVTVAAMTACAVAVREAAPEIALGVNVLRNDADAALAIAAVSGASCIRVNVHTGARVTDQGVVQGEAASTLRRRRELGAEAVQIWADVDVKHSAPLAVRSVEDEALDLVHRGMADAVLVTGAGTGRAADTSKLRAVRAAVGARVPILVASGATIEALDALAETVDGVIVGSALRDGGVAGGPIDRARAAAFARGFAQSFPRRGR
jgi:membrane complex biogenesis BtpA family protein